MNQSSVETNVSPPWLDTAKFMYLYVIGAIITGILPLLFGRLVSEGRLNVTEMGELATWELLAMGVASTVSGFWFRVRYTRIVAIIATTLLLFMNLLSIHAAGMWLVVVRVVAGAQGGILTQIAVAWVARTPKPAVASSEFTFALGCAQLAFGAVLAGLLPRFGSAGGFVFIALTIAVAVVVSLRTATPHQEVAKIGTSSMPPLSGWMSLMSVFFYLCFIFAVTTYAVPLAIEKGMTANDGDNAVVASLVGQMVGAGSSIWMARKFTWFPIVSLLAIGCGLALVALWATTNSTVFVAISWFLGFGPMIVIAFQIPFAVDADSTRKSASLVPGAQLLGSAAGPFVASLGVQQSSVRNVIAVGGLCLVGSSVTLLATRLSISRRAN